MNAVPNQRDEPEPFQSLAGSCRQTGDTRHQRGLARVGDRPRLVFCFSVRFGRRGYFRLGGQDECLDGGFSNHDARLEELSPGEGDGLVDLHFSFVTGPARCCRQSGAAGQVQQIRQRFYSRVFHQLRLLRDRVLRSHRSDAD